MIELISIFFKMEWVVILAGLFHAIYTPYTKVEESFNVQAVHDILYNGLNISQYDHLDFPGVVPRTFIGPIFLAILSAPFVYFSELLNFGDKFFAQFIVRTVLCLSVVLSLIRFSRALRSNLGHSFSWWYLLICTSQYHFIYYSSRPLPNILALPLTLCALHAALTQRNPKAFLWFSGAAIVWFRSELGLLLGIVLLIQIFEGKTKPRDVVKIAVPAGLTLIGATVLIDSFFWRRLVWPEAEVFYFNVILNKSSDWGTSPFLWYFYSALPRGLASSYFLIPLGVYWEPRVRRLIGAAFLFILCFSFLPHKELRFIIYTFPLLNTAVAAACHRLWQNRVKSKFQLLLGIAVVGHILVNIVFTLFLLMVARVNYPGGVAISRLHQIVPSDRPVNVHIENLAAQTGVSRFTQLNDNWKYSKIENLTRGSPASLRFTHLIVEAKSKYSANLKPYTKTHRIIESIEGFSEIAMNYQLIPPVRIKTKPLLFILERNPNIVPPDISDDDFAESLQETSNEEIKNVNEDIADSDEKVQSTEKVEVEYDNLSSENGNAETFERDSALEEEDKNIQEELDSKHFEFEGDDTDSYNENDFEESAPEDQMDDLLAVDSKQIKEIFENEDSDVKSEEQSDSFNVNFGNIIKNLEDALTSGEENRAENVLNEILQSEDIINDIKLLSGVDVDNSNPELAKLKDAFKSILHYYKENILDVDSSHSNLEKSSTDFVEEERREGTKKEESVNNFEETNIKGALR